MHICEYSILVPILARFAYIVISSEHFSVSLFYISSYTKLRFFPLRGIKNSLSDCYLDFFSFCNKKICCLDFVLIFFLMGEKDRCFLTPHTSLPVDLEGN
ncbi:hypothetical protein Lalb_Chr03g0027571 [Lupinus albus]|uniref:Uncharacterized protein n=1 Tax=Lupinus albus TaxID=3870 RepID=A0A6A4QQU3_LUPAL|nr:hypothetical protein Lalb_Chr03g0027571 [Lupinus albus]